MSETITPTPAGWYEDPWGTAAWRYWDGSDWTSHTSGGSESSSPETTEQSWNVPTAPPAEGATSNTPVPNIGDPARTGAKERLLDLLGNRLAMVGAAMSAVVLLVMAVAVLSGSDQRSVTGEFALFDDTGAVTLDVGDGCEGTGGYSDIYAGTQVRVSDAAGQLIATGKLEPGEIQRTPAGKACVLPFAVDDLPDSAFYTFEVSHRGELTYSRTEMADRDWHVSLQLGQ